jgi:hypothetical protein
MPIVVKPPGGSTGPTGRKLPPGGIPIHPLPPPSQPSGSTGPTGRKLPPGGIPIHPLPPPSQPIGGLVSLKIKQSVDLALGSGEICEHPFSWFVERATDIGRSKGLTDAQVVSMLSLLKQRYQSSYAAYCISTGFVPPDQPGVTDPPGGGAPIPYLPPPDDSGGVGPDVPVLIVDPPFRPIGPIYKDPNGKIPPDTPVDVIDHRAYPLPVGPGDPSANGGFSIAGFSGGTIGLVLIGGLILSQLLKR